MPPNGHPPALEPEHLRFARRFLLALLTGAALRPPPPSAGPCATPAPSWPSGSRRYPWPGSA